MTSAPRSASCMPTPFGPRSELSMTRTPARSPPVTACWIAIETAYHVTAAAVTRAAPSPEDATAGDRAAAIDRDQGTGHELALAAREVHDGIRDVVRLPEPRQVHRLELRAPLGRQLVVAALVHHVAHGDRVAADVLVGMVDGHGSREGVEASLARDVCSETGARALGLPGGHVHDRSVTGREHVADGGAAEPRDAGQVHAQHPLPDRGVERSEER